MAEICKKKECGNPSVRRGLCQEHYDKVRTNERNYENRNEETRKDPNRGRSARSKYNKSEKGKLSSKKRQMRYLAKPEKNLKKRTKQKETRSAPEYKEKQHAIMQTIKKEVFSAYSKRHSNSETPICRCCGQSIFEFLEFDHIEGRNEMANDPKARKWGYKSAWTGEQLWTKVKECNEKFEFYPEGFQVLCSNCNQSKKNSGVEKTCFHELVRDPKFKIPVTYRRKLRKIVFSYYSKKHDDSSIPICHCCKEDFIELLTLDHIQGKKEMDNISELTSLGYSSKLEISKLLVWIKNNNYLSDLKREYFQVLCYNCNQSKGRTSKDNICQHKKIHN